MELSNSPLGIKRRLRIIGVTDWNHYIKSITFLFEIEAINSQGQLLNDKVLKQSRQVLYILTNSNKVNSQFNPVETGGTGEYDFFFNSMSTTLFPTLISNLANKLNERGIFD